VYQEINAALQSLNVLSNWISANKTLSNYNELAAAVSEVNAKLLQAQTIATASQEKISLLMKRIAELEEIVTNSEKWEQKIQCYNMTILPSGSIVYIMNTQINGSNPIHYICADGVNKREIHILQPIGEGLLLRCNICKVMVQTEELSHAKLKHILTNVERMGYV